jgi:ParB/RepB/Spo0J family partition protein
MRSQALDELYVPLDDLGKSLQPLRLCEPEAVAAMRHSLEHNGQLTSVVVFEQTGRLEIIDGFKRLRAARTLDWNTLRVERVTGLTAVEAKIAIGTLHARRGLTEIEEGWLVRSLCRDDGLRQDQVARRLGRHKSWVCRRLMLVESLDQAVQADVRLGLLAARTAVVVAQLPRGNQVRAAELVVRHGLTLRQAETLVIDLLECSDDASRAAWLERRFDASPTAASATKMPRRARSEAEGILSDTLALRRTGARLQARLLSRPLAALGPGAAELLIEALVALAPVLGKLEETIERVTASAGKSR